MRHEKIITGMLTLALGAATVLAGSRSSVNYSIGADGADSGGQRTASANYTTDGSMGGVGGNSSGADYTTKNGYIGQLTEVSSLALTGTPWQVNEGAASQCGGTATLDDGTVVALAGSDVNWGAYAWPICDVSPSGMVTTTNVYQNTTVPISGSYLAVVGSGSLLVLDSNPDNYGNYAGDGIPDAWQAHYFGLNNTNASPNADADGTGQDNLSKYIAGLDPTNPASVFEIVAVTNQPPSRLVYIPSLTGRVYSLTYATDMLSGPWFMVAGQTNMPGIGGNMSLSDANAAATRFYRVTVQLP